MMKTIFGSTPSEDAKNVLRLLKDNHNVIITGPPATGKSRLLAEVRYWFQKPTNPSFKPTGDSVFPSNIIGQSNTMWHPSPSKTSRRVFQITFHQGTKYRDFIAGLVPDSTGKFKVVYGKFHQAATYSLINDCAALLEIDELNRANAVAVFGDTITAIESDKRLLEDNSVGELTSVYSTLNNSGELIDQNLSCHLYIIGAMNNADTSVQPLDIAFLRRFENYCLKPSESILRDYFGLTSKVSSLPASPNSFLDVFEVLVQSWLKINEDISLIRGDDYQIGQGLFMKLRKVDLPSTIPDALEYLAQGWNRLFTHLLEVFFGDTVSLSSVIRANAPGNPYFLETRFYSGTSISRIVMPHKINTIDVYSLMLAIVNAPAE